MYILETYLDHYFFDSSEFTSERKLTWWVLERDEEGYEKGRTFTQEEEIVFRNYVINNKYNFPREVNYSNADSQDAPSIELIDSMSIMGLPNYVVLRSHPEKYSGEKATVMDIRLSPEHTYKLPFNVIGEFERVY